MGTNQNFMNTALNGPMQNFGAYGGYQNFANTGGYSDSDLQNIRARSVAPLRATYANANADVDRQKSLQGGYAPNYIAAKAKMARELGYGLADANTNVEASIADAVRQGKLAGLGGMTNIDNSLLGAQTSRLGIGANALSNMTSLYGTAPGQAKLYGDLMNNSSQLGLGTEQLQEQKMRDILNAYNNLGNTKGNYESTMDNVNSTIKGGANLAGIFSGF